LVPAALALAFAGAATAAAPTISGGGDVHESLGQGDTTALQQGVTYTAARFPVVLRLRPPDSHWGGRQYVSGRFAFVQLGHSRTGSVPRHGVGDITIEAGSGSTPTVAATAARLHATPKMKVGPLVPTHVAGFAGEMFDATILDFDPGTYDPAAQRGISLVPYTTNHHCGYCTDTMRGETQDAKFAAKDQLFRIIVIGVKGKTVVIYVESTYHDQPKFLPAQTFPTFVPYAQKMLAALSFR
jgi:hypothetical protein